MAVVKVLGFIAAGLATFLVGGVLGVWVGSITEQDAIVTLVAQADLTTECRAQLESAIKEIIRASESEQPAARP
jgi:hypothetical protein